MAETLLILDTSVVLKWFLETGEPDLVAARSIRRAFLSGRCRLGAPDILLMEVANALTTGRGASPKDVAETITAIIELGIRLIDLQVDALVQAVEMASVYRAAVYDTYFLAMAMDMGGLLVTADEAFLRKIKTHVNLTSLRDLRLPDA